MSIIFDGTNSAACRNLYFFFLRLLPSALLLLKEVLVLLLPPLLKVLLPLLRLSSRFLPIHIVNSRLPSPT